VELILRELHHQGAIPVQMTFEGINFDVATGLSAPLVAYLAQRGQIGRRGLLAWNAIGLALLCLIVVVANLSTPAFHVFAHDRPTSLLADRPFIWLPMVLVPAAFMGHLLTFRRLAQAPRAPEASRETRRSAAVP
jgi:hypothetical protein